MIRRIVFIILLAMFFALPPAVLVIYSFSSSWRFPGIIPDAFDTRAVTFIIEDRANILISLLSSFIYSSATVLVTLSVTLLPARVFARKNFRFKAAAESLLITPALLPAISFAMGAHYIFLKSGLADTIGGVILILSVTAYPYMLRALTAGFAAYGEEYSICAENLGASFSTVIFRIEFPLILPSVISGGTIVFLVAFSEYFMVFLIGGGSVPSYSGYIFPFLNSSDHSIASLLTLIFLAVPLLLFAGVEIFSALYYRKRFFN